MTDGAATGPGPMQDSASRAVSRLLDRWTAEAEQLPSDVRRRLLPGLLALRRLAARDDQARAVLLGALAAAALAERRARGDRRRRRFSDDQLVTVLEASRTLAEAAATLGVAPSTVTRRVRTLRLCATGSGG